MFIALTGTIGSGKNTVAEYIVNKYGFVFASGSEIIAERVKERGLLVTRENMRVIANELRSKNGNMLIDLTIDKVSIADYSVIGFLRTENEIKRLKELKPHAILIAVDAPVDVRYQRVVQRNEEKDQVSFEEFVRSEEIEMNSKDPNTQNMQYCIEHSDHMIRNDSNLENLYSKIDALLK